MESLLNIVSTFATAIAILAVVGIVLLVLWLIYRRRYRRVGPDEALIVYGKRAKKTEDGFRIIVGGGTFIKPFIEQAEIFPTKAFQLSINLTGVLAGTDRTPLNVRATATVKVPVTPEERSNGYPAVRQAVGNFLGSGEREIMDALTEVVAGHLRNIVANLSAVDLYENQAQFAEQLKQAAATEMNSLGYVFLSSVFREITDDNGYLESLGVPEIERARREARIAQANMQRDASIAEDNARQESEERRLGVEGEIADNTRELDLRRAANQQRVDVANAEARKAGERAALEQDIQIAERTRERTKAELDATVREKADADLYARQRSAEASRFSNEQDAEAARFRAEQEAESERIRRAKSAEALELESRAQATQAREVGLAEADATRAQGEAEAEARRQLAEALRLYSEAGVSLEALKVLPDVVRAAAEPLSQAGETTIISNGSGPGTGVSKMLGNVTEAAGVGLPLMKTLAGVDLVELLAGITGATSSGPEAANGDHDEDADAVTVS